MKKYSRFGVCEEHPILVAINQHDEDCRLATFTDYTDAETVADLCDRTTAAIEALERVKKWFVDGESRNSFYETAWPAVEEAIRNRRPPFRPCPKDKEPPVIPQPVVEPEPEEQMPEKIWWTRQEIAAMFNVSIHTVDQRIKAGKIKHKKFGRFVRVHDREVQRICKEGF